METKEDIIKICEEIENKYGHIESDIWYQICEILLNRAD